MIILMRHGRVARTGAAWIGARALRDYVDGYNNAAVLPPATELPTPCNTPLIVCSTQRRSKDSATIRFGKFDHSDAVFNEAGLPDIALPPIPMPAPLLMVLSRLGWFMGRHKGCEPYGRFKDRAQDAAQTLIGLSEGHDCVVLVGHGMLNRFIARSLLENGCSGPKRPSSKHWDCTTYTPATSRVDSKD